MNLKDGDLDVMAVTNKQIDHESFFSGFTEYLKGQEGVKNCRAITSAFVPIIELQIDDFDVDLLYAQVAGYESGTNIYALDLEKVDSRWVSGISGVRNTMAIASVVAANQENFQWAAKAIKHWAQCKSPKSKYLKKIKLYEKYLQVKGFTVTSMATLVEWPF